MEKFSESLAFTIVVKDHHHHRRRESTSKSLSISKTKIIQQPSIQLTSCPRLPHSKPLIPTIRIDKKKMVQILEEENVFRRVVSKIGFNTLKQNHRAQTKHRKSESAIKQQFSKGMCKKILSETIKRRIIESSGGIKSYRNDEYNAKLTTNSKNSLRTKSTTSNPSSPASFKSDISIQSRSLINRKQIGDK
nr:uncharacterized protein LOC124492312 [Dermatophagoides farinae]